MALKASNKYWLSSTLFSMGELYMLMEDYPSALNYFRQAFQIDEHGLEQFRKVNDWDIWVKMEYAEIFAHLGQFDSAWHYFNLYRPKQNSDTYYRVYLVSTGECYFLQGQYATALGHFRQGLLEHRKRNDRNEIMRTLLFMGQTSLAMGNIQDALAFGQEGLQLALQTRARQFTRDGYGVMYTVYDKLQRPDSANYYFRRYAAMKDSVANDLTKGKFAAYKYGQQITLLDKERELQQNRLEKASLQKKILAAGMALLLVIGGLLLRHFTYKRRQEKRQMVITLKMQRLESEKQQFQLEQQASELEMQALRAQMNPHFIFNCLSSINRFILKNETAAASDYLTRFSRLIRMILNHSMKSQVTLEEELEMLCLYLDMEKLRFRNSFDYSLHIHGQLQTSSVFIPPLLLQPFAENAVWHGLMHKEGQGRLDISLETENQVLYCVMADNGVGRSAAAAWKSKSAEKEKSMGMHITRERLALINGSTNNNPFFSIEDLYDGEGNAAGTKVCLRIKYTTDASGAPLHKPENGHT
jgi:tetratricopeptide (TPR) repeat protein